MSKLLLSLALLMGLCLNAGAYTAYNLGDTISVANTELHIDIRDLPSHTIYGKAILNVKSKMDGLRHIPLQLLHLNIDSVYVNDMLTIGTSYNDTLMQIPLPYAINSGDSVKVRVVYHGTPYSNKEGGFSWNDQEGMAHNLGSSVKDIPHCMGKCWFPCIDDFRSRTYFDCYYRTDADRMAVGNGLLVGKDTLDDTSIVWHWRLGQPIPCYLASVAVGNYENIHMNYRGETRNIPIDIYVTPDELEQARACYAIIPKVMTVMERHFGEYRFDRVGFVSVNSPLGAMEHACNIAMMREPNTGFKYVSVVIHELIHHWFGNLVTCDSEKDIWLNEGITSYVVAIVTESLYGELQTKYYNDYLKSHRNYISKDSEDYHALYDMPLKDTYGILTYLKGGEVTGELHKLLGDELFFKGMRQYLEDYAFRTATTEDFKRSLEKTTGKELTKFFQKNVYE